jgi:transaldolase
MRPQKLRTKIFLDSGDPKETQEIVKLLGFLDGQTTNPTYIARNPEAQARLLSGNKFNSAEAYSFYKEVVRQISEIIPEGSVSIEVNADKDTSSFAMFQQGKEFFKWIPNAHIKFPVTEAGLEAAEQAVKEGMRVNITLVFSQGQAAAVHAATKGADRGQVFISPFISRLDEIGESGMDLLSNIIQMYHKPIIPSRGALENGKSHVEVLAASIRTLDQLLYSIKAEANIVTAPFRVLKEWAEAGLPVPDESFVYNPANLRMVAYQDCNLDNEWRSFDLQHDLTDKGLEKFTQDWNNLIKF